VAALSGAIHCDGERCTDLAHPVVAESTQAIDEHADRDTLDGIEVHRGEQRYRVGARFQHDLAGKAPDRGGTRGHERPFEARDGGITTEDDDRSSTDVGQLTPPELTSLG